MNTERDQRGGRIIDACLAMGFACAGIAPARPTAHADAFHDWLNAGKHGDMDFMAEYVAERLDVGVLLPGARSVIVVADQYAERGNADDAGMVTADAREPMGKIARYARGRDYHAVIKNRLHNLCDRLRVAHRGTGAKFRAFVDTGPAMEREHAARAAMGGAFIGKHTLLIHPRLGSWLLLGGVATTLELEPGASGDAPAAAVKTDHCGTCTRCIDACPTGAIAREGWSVDATRCVSYLTLEHKGPIGAEFHAGVGDRLIGCDVCQEVCPFNQPHEHDAEAHDQPRLNPSYRDRIADGASLARLPVLEVLRWSDGDRARVLSGSAAKRASLEMLRRNAVVVAANAWKETGDPLVLRAIEERRDDEAEAAIVRETARIALESMRGDQG